MSEQEWEPCPITGCGRSRRNGQLMCSRHWFSIPQRLRGEVWRTWKAWRKDLADDELARAYLDARDSAIEAVPV